MTSFLDLAKITVSEAVMKKTISHLQSNGERGDEAFVLWVGTQSGLVFNVSDAVVPQQVAHRTPQGVYVTIPGEELHRINVWLFEQKLQLIAQVHSHPSDAFHSDLDDALPIATRAGSLSVVIPNFGLDGFSYSETAVFQLNDKAIWERLSEARFRDLLVIRD